MVDDNTRTFPRFDPEALRRIAGAQSFARGVEYHQDDSVEIVAIDGKRVIAHVFGSERYEVELTADPDGPSGWCTCPAAERGFCKHLVAVGLASSKLQADSASLPVELSAIRAHLAGRGTAALVDIIMGVAERDPDLLRKLAIATDAATTDGATLFRRLSRALAAAAELPEDRGWESTGAWASRIGDALADIEPFVASHAAAVVELMEDLFPELEEALEVMEDYDDQGAALMVRAIELHHAACRAAPVDPLALARTLFDRETESPWDFFDRAEAQYADVLGDAGIAEYARLAEQAWKREKPLGRGGKGAGNDAPEDLYRVAAILERLALARGDIDACIAVRVKNLSTPASYLALAELCAEHGRLDTALRWAEEGLFVCEDTPDDRLIAGTAALYARAGRATEAQELLWRRFERAPSFDLYRRLRELAGSAAGTWGDRAVSLLQERCAETSGKPPLTSTTSLLIQLLLHERRLDAAWAAAREHGCDDGLLASLAGASEVSHPADALGAYADLVERAVSGTGKSGYERACELVERMKTIRQRLDRHDEQAAYVAELALRHKAKRNFVKLLRAAR